MNGQLVSKKKWTKEEWRQHNREAQEKVRRLIVQGQIEKIENEMARLRVEILESANEAEKVFAEALEKTFRLEEHAALLELDREARRFLLFELFFGGDFLPEWLASFERED